ncbi:ras-related protein Rab-7L1-like [Pollicipes pollicipes]|uniref:ras-related protein Rab-7L1-like n=1 Tax=Pollicipes pollicipes TaxID=41117 RepID=UPI0018856A6B|nr:ras-related protein Rab-7L1-like [Pollicipes pollicipes]
MTQGQCLLRHYVGCTLSGQCSPAPISPKERPLSATWRDELSGSLELDTPTTPQEAAAIPGAPGEPPRPRTLSGPPYKLLVVGDRGVGKSAIVARYVCDAFCTCHEPTAGVRSSTKTAVSLEDADVTVQITELSPEWSFQGMAEVFYKEAHGCVVVFDLGERQSLRSALQWKRRIDELCCLPGGGGVPSLLLANKVTSRPVAARHRPNSVSDLMRVD